MYKHGELKLLAEQWTAGDMMVQDSLRNCKLAFLSACETGNVGFEGLTDEYSGLPAALQLLGVPTIVCSLWPVSDELATLYVDLFYDALVKAPQPIDVAALAHSVAERLRTMRKKEAEARLNRLKQLPLDPLVRFRLEERAHAVANGGEFPFGQPYEWAAFYVIGRSKVSLEEDARVSPR
jgi:CHAT domain-containing protein